MAGRKRSRGAQSYSQQNDARDLERQENKPGGIFRKEDGGQNSGCRAAHKDCRRQRRRQDESVLDEATRSTAHDTRVIAESSSGGSHVLTKTTRLSYPRC